MRRLGPKGSGEFTRISWDQALERIATELWVHFRSRILEFSPERVASITGLTVESIVELGRRLAETRPTGIRIGIGMRFLIRLAARRRGRPT
jgi:anaerobic selenocysteine-containing dehydrogenase